MFPRGTNRRCSQMAVAPAELYKSSGFEESVLNNYWCDIEP